MYIINSAGKVIKIGGDMSVKQTVDFSHLGLDSLMSIKVRSILARTYIVHAIIDTYILVRVHGSY
jgi:hypothetical protein